VADNIPKAQWARVLKRDDRECWWTGRDTDQNVPQHRQGGMGGRRDKHRLPMVLTLNSIINGLFESDPEWQAAARAYGMKVSMHVRDVALVPVFHVARRRWFRLDGDERTEIGSLIALDMMLAVYGDEYLEWKARADDTERSRILALRGGR
jgi:hypothetical protein